MGTIRSSSPVLDASGNPASRRIVLAYRRDTGALIGRGMTSDGAGDASLSSVELLMLTRGYNDSLAVMDYSPNQKAITLAGNVKLTTAQGRYENASLVLDGNNDMLVWDLRDPLDTGLLVYIGGQDVAFPLRFYVGAADRISGASITADTWFHVAWSRIAGVSRLFIDGVQQGSNYTDTTNYTSEVLTIGGRYTPASGDYRSFNGNLGALRVTNGVGRYAAGFTPPSAPPQAFDNTLGAGHYQIDTGSYAGECTVVLLDDFEGDTQNDLVLRTTPV
jgi:Concanavalin A-like lectin/glucanases superfamily